MLLQQRNISKHRKTISHITTAVSLNVLKELEDLEEQYDNPQRAQLSSKFLETYVEASNSLVWGSKNNEGKFIKSPIPTFRQAEKYSAFRQIAKNKQNQCMQQLHIKQYIFLLKIGEGTFGEVYKVQDKITGQIKAMKIIKKRKSVSNTCEGDVLANCLHQNIVKMYEYFESDQFSYLVMEFCDKQSPLSKVKSLNYVCDEKIAKQVIKQILKALDFLHKKAIVHRDIKLQNIVFSQSQSDSNAFIVKIIDFGNSNEMKFQVNQTYEIYGTTVYMPPQAFSGCYTSTYDIWSCGVILHILLSGICPFKRRTKQESQEAIKNFKISYEGQIWSKVSSSSKNLLLKMLTKDYLKRPSAAECLSHEWFIQ